jgi:hypothetical protein
MTILNTIGLTTKSVASVPVDFGKAGMEMFFFENPLPKMKESVKRGAWDTLALTPRLAWDMVKGMAMGTLHLTWSAIKLLPIPLPLAVRDAWGKERHAAIGDTQRALDLFRFDLDQKFVLPPMGTAQTQQPETPQTLAA